MREGAIRPGAQLPTVRDLATRLRVSPTTVAAAYRNLRLRGLLVAAGRRGSAISHHPPIGARPAQVVPAHARDLASGNPDLKLLPALGPALRAIDDGRTCSTATDLSRAGADARRRGRASRRTASRPSRSPW